MSKSYTTAAAAEATAGCLSHQAETVRGHAEEDINAKRHKTRNRSLPAKNGNELIMDGKCRSHRQAS